MFIVFGTKRNQKVLGNSKDVHQCKNCLRETHFKITFETHWFTIYWLPILPFALFRSVICPVCGEQIKKNRKEIIKSREVIDNFK